MPGKLALFLAFAFTVMADPVSSVAYAIQAALRELDGDLGGLVLTMALVVGTVAIVAATYHQVIRRFPEGGGGARSVAAAYGDGWAFVPLGALLVDFTITVAISCAAGASAIIAYVPGLASSRVLLALGLTALVAIGISFGHRGRLAFAAATLAFLVLAVVVIGSGAIGGAAVDARAGAAHPLVADASLIPVLLAMPLAMALATGIEAPSDAIAQLGQLDRRDRRRFGQWTIWLTVGIVGALTLGISVLAVTLGVGLPPSCALLLLAAAASSYLAASGLLKALALVGSGRGDRGLVSRRFARVNRFHTPPWGVVTVFGASATLIAIAAGRDQEIVQFYAVSVFAAFLAALLACARLSLRDRRWTELAINALGVVLVTFVLALNVTRLDGAIALGVSAAVAAYLYLAWVRQGRPSGVGEVEISAT